MFRTTIFYVLFCFLIPIEFNPLWFLIAVFLDVV